MLRLPAALSVETFLEGYWHKVPLFMPRALPPRLPALLPDELAWLATQPDVESRLVMTEAGTAADRYTVRHGPFGDAELAALPDRDWTLLVHDVDKHLPDLRDWLAAVPFIPDWRIDDLMVSCAAPGGSVGPHRDHYDVFLCQGSGRREWRVAESAAELKEVPDSELAVLGPFADPDARVAGRDDVLYLPPGVAHWGLATELCVTYSIGMRAPTHREFLAGIDRVLGRPAAPVAGEDRYYADADLTADESLPGEISRAALGRARRLLGDAVTLPDSELAQVFAAIVTDPKAWLVPDAGDADAFRQRLATAATLPVHGMARLAWCDAGSTAWAGVNGFVRRVDDSGLRTMVQLCAHREARLSPDCDAELFAWLWECGTFDTTEPYE